MSHRPPTSPLVGFLLLLLAGVALSPFVSSQAAAFGEHPFESNQVIKGTTHQMVYSGQTFAQSFLATASYQLQNVTMRLRNAGDTSDAIAVTIRADAAGAPAATSLALTQVVINNNNIENRNVPFAIPVPVSQGSRYWIVAACASNLPNGYEWHDSGADVYPDGQAQINRGIGGWVDPPSAPTDMYFVTYGRETDANLTTTIRATSYRASPGDLVTFRVYLNNTGNSAAPRAWLNDTQLAGLTYVSDTAASAGSSTPWPSFVFSNVGNGPLSFGITIRVPIGTEAGTLLTKGLTLTYQNATGVLRTAPSTQASLFVGEETKQLYLIPMIIGSSEALSPVQPTGGPSSQTNQSFKRDGSTHDFDLNPVLARAFQVYGVNVTLYLDSGSHDQKNLDINLTLTDWNGVTLTPVAYVQQRVTTNVFSDFQPFSFAFPAMNHTFPSGGRVRFTIRNMGTSGSDAILAMNSTFASSHLDLDTTTYVRIDLLDMRDAKASTLVWSPRDALVVRANVSDPLGSTEITGARIYITSPSGALLVNDTVMTILATDRSVPSAWKVFQFTYAPPLTEGTYQVTVSVAETNGVADVAQASALVRTPHFTLVKTATRSNVRSGDRFSYDIWYNNTGPGTAGRVWINDSLPAQLTFTTSSDPPAMTGSYNWTWTSLAPGNYHLRIDVLVNGGLPPIPYLRNVAVLTYADEKGFVWPMMSTYADVAVRGPVISLSKTGSKSIIHANETISYTLTLQNAGDQAQTLWVNDTLPQELAYFSDTAASHGGTTNVSGRTVYFQFANMPRLATWSFVLTATAGPALVRGSILTAEISLNYTNSNGYLLPPRSASWSVTVTAPYIASAVVMITRNQATPADVITAVVTYANTGNEPAHDVWVNLTLDPLLYFLNASVSSTLSGNVVSFRLTNIAIGTTVIRLNASVDASISDHQLLTIGGTLAYTDQFLNFLPSVVATSDSVEAAVPRIVLTVTPNDTSVEAGGLVFFNVYQVNAGSGIAGDVWLTLPLPAGFVYKGDNSDGGRSVVGSTYTWHWTNVAPGPKSFSLELMAKSSVLDRTGTNLTFHTDYTDANGNLRPGETRSVSVDFVAPRIELSLTASRQDAHPGDSVTYNLTIHNIGSSSARNLWLTDQIDPHLGFVSYVSSVPKTGTNPFNWSFTDIQPGQVETVVLVLRLADGTPARSLITNSFEVVYTNSGGDTVVGYARSDAAPVYVAVDALPLAYIVLGGLAFGLLAVFIVLRRSKVAIEEVFLVYRDGVLIYHLSRSLSQDKDEDVLSGMLTAVQEFVRDAFVYGEHRELHQLDFGEYRILLERGKNLYLAVVYSGKGTSAVRRRVRRVLDHVEVAYGSVLERWDGDMDKVVGARDLIREYLLKPKGLRNALPHRS